MSNMALSPNNILVGFPVMTAFAVYTLIHTVFLESNRITDEEQHAIRSKSSLIGLRSAHRALGNFDPYMRKKKKCQQESEKHLAVTLQGLILDTWYKWFLIHPLLMNHACVFTPNRITERESVTSDYKSGLALGKCCEKETAVGWGLRGQTLNINCFRSE